jgi:zinc transporter ZupT
MNGDILVYCVVIFLAALAGGMLMMVRRWSEEWLHAFLSLGAGVFMGAVFMHLLPEAMRYDRPAQMGLLLMIGYLFIAFVERCLPAAGFGNGLHRHMVVSVTALVGLSVHSVIAGFGLAVARSDAALSSVLFVSILAHKVPAAFSLSSLMILAEHSRKRVIYSLLAFAAMTPVGALVLAPVLARGGEGMLMSLTGLVSGSLLYVATSNLLPEVFHARRKLWLNLILLLIGILAMGLGSGMLTHEHY